MTVHVMPAPAAPAVRTFADITPTEPEWLWPGCVPCGTVTVLAAPGGIGKSFSAAELPRVSAAAT